MDRDKDKRWKGNLKTGKVPRANKKKLGI